MQQQAGFAFPGAGAVVAGVGQTDPYAVAEPGGQRVEYLGVDRGLAGVAGEVGLVD